MSDLVKTAMGWNFASSQLGEEVMRDIVALVLDEKIKPVVGQTIAFADIPVAIEAMESRQTVGRTIVLVD
jgi:NADPH:quinone reductase-like Zn-dependent oxidoreductase